MVAGLSAPAAHAGFEWNAPPPAASVSAPSFPAEGPAVAAPAPEVFSEPLSPAFTPPPAPIPLDSGLVINPYPQSGFDPAQDDPFLLGQDGGFSDPAPAAAAPISLTDLPMPGAGAVASRSHRAVATSAGPLNPVTYAEVQGFARDIPLAIALSQVVPADFTYSFGPDVNPGIPVSWQGGVGWDQVLQSMLSPQGLGASIRGRTVYVGSGAAPLSAPSPALALTQPAIPTPLSPVLKASDGNLDFIAAPGLPQKSVTISRASDDLTTFPPATRAAPLPAPNFPLSPAPSPAESLAAPVTLSSVESQPLPGSSFEQTPQSADPLFDQALQKPGQGGGRFNPAPETGSDGFNPPSQDFIPVSIPAQDQEGSPVSRSGSGIEKIRTWRGVRGDSLRTIMTDWSEDAGVEVYWASQFDYPLDSSVRFTGTFEEAVKNLLSGLRDARPRPVARLHPNLPDGPPVLVLETQQVIQ
jgi:hypothetical protein